MRYLVAGSSHYIYFILRAIREIDPRGLIYYIDKYSEAAREPVSQFNINFIQGDPLDPSTYQSADAESVDVSVIATDSDALNIRLIELFKRFFGVPKVVAVANNPMNLEEYKNSGADLVINPITNIETMIKAFISSDKWIKSSTPEIFGLDVYLNRFVRDAVFGITLSYIRDAVRDLGDVLVFVVKRDGGIVRDPLYELAEGDTVVVVSPHGLGEEAIKRIERSIDKLKVLRADVETGVSRP